MYFVPMLIGNANTLSDTQTFWERQAQTVLVTGAQSPLGCRVVERLNQSGWIVRVLLSPGQTRPVHLSSRVISVEGSLTNGESLKFALQDCHRVLHLEELALSRNPEQLRTENIEYTRSLVKACKEANVRQFVLVSTAKICYRTHSSYSRTKKTAEDVLRGSGLNWTIVRPTLVVGSDGSPEYHWLRSWVKRSRFLPIPERGSVVKRPVHEDDFSEGLDLLLCANPSVVAHKTYFMAGRSAMTVTDLVHMIAGEHSLSQRIVLDVPTWFFQIGAHALRWTLPHLPVNFHDLLRGLLEDCDPDIQPAMEDFGFRPRHIAGRLARVTHPEAPTQHPTPRPSSQRA